MSGDLAPGLPADWLNGWLAAVGSTVLVPGLRLAWTPTPRPVAQLTTPDGKSAARSLAEAFPTRADVERLSIARTLSGSLITFERHVDHAAFIDRAKYARLTGDLSLGATVTDLIANLDTHDLEHSPLDPPAPRGVTLWDRLVSLVDATNTLDSSDDLEEHIRSSLAGTGSLVNKNGLGFDYRRLTPSTYPTPRSLSVDPIIEVLAFFGLLLFPFRGNGWTTSLRGWYRDDTSRHWRLIWPAWEHPLDRWAIDALLDVPPPIPLNSQLSVFRFFESVEYESRGTLDSTRALAARRLR